MSTPLGAGFFEVKGILKGGMMLVVLVGNVWRAVNSLCAH
jgi:hypothetical protein